MTLRQNGIELLGNLMKQLTIIFNFYTSEDYKLKKEIGMAIDKIHENFKILQFLNDVLFKTFALKRIFYDLFNFQNNDRNFLVLGACQFAL